MSCEPVSCMSRSFAFALCGLAVPGLLFSSGASAHGFAGKRFFPATLAVDDPFVADELALPTISSRKVPGEGDSGSVRENSYSFEFAKRITENFGIGVSGTYLDLRPAEGDKQRGWDNFGVSAKYQFYTSAEHEAIVSAGIDWDIAHTGSRSIGAEPFHTFTPAIFFGKGLGDLSNDAKWLRPLAVTGMLGVGIPSKASTSTVNDEGETDVERHPNTLEWGFTFQYSIPYLQANVQDIGWHEPFNRLIPIVEFPMSTALNRGASGTTGTANPGLLWVGKYVQFGVEAVIPLTRQTGSHTGWIAQLHWFLDDLYPQSVGRPMVH